MFFFKTFQILFSQIFQITGKKRKSESPGPKPSPSKDNKEKKVTIMKVLIYLLVSNFATCNAQKIFFSEKAISIHSQRKILDLTSTHILIDNIVTQIKKTAKDEMVKVKANACISKLKRLKNNFSNDSDIIQLKRHKRGISLIGELLSSVSDIPSPSEWKDNLRTLKDLAKLAKKEGTVLKHVKGKIDVESKDLESLKIELKDMKNKERSQSNALKKALNELDQSIIVDALCYNGETLISESEHENRIINEITLKAYRNLPSKFMFPADKINDIIHKVATDQKIHRPIFYSKNELNEIYQLESTITAFKPENDTIISLMHLPLFDYSNELITVDIPILESSDMDRLHKFESLANKKIDIFLCSENKNSVRFYASDDLKTCQKHANKNFFVCNERIISLRMPYKQQCKEIALLPEALVLEIGHNLLLVDSPFDNMIISCPVEKEKENITKIKASEHPIKISLPEKCTLESDKFRVGKAFSNDDRKIKTFEPEAIKIMHLKYNPGKIHFENRDNNTNTHSNSTVKTSNDYDEELLNDIEYDSNAITSEIANIGAHSISFTAIIITLSTIGIVAFKAVITTIFIKRQVNNSGNEIKRLNMEIDKCNKTTEALKSDLKLAQENINALKLAIKESPKKDNFMFSTTAK